MWNSIEEMAIYLVCALLKVVIKNPAAVSKEKSVVAQIAQLSTEADTAVNGTVWSNAPATPAAPAA
jgi:hypothetical protein